MEADIHLIIESFSMSDNKLENATDPDLYLVKEYIRTG